MRVEEDDSNVEEARRRASAAVIHWDDGASTLGDVVDAVRHWYHQAAVRGDERECARARRAGVAIVEAGLGGRRDKAALDFLGEVS